MGMNTGFVRLESSYIPPGNAAQPNYHTVVRGKACGPVGMGSGAEKLVG